MRNREYHIGPGAASLLLIAVVLSLCALCLLSLTGAKSDLQLTKRSAAVGAEIARLNDASERSLAKLDAVLLACSGAADDEEYLEAVAASLPDYMMIEENTVFWTETGDGRELECAADIAPLGEFPRVNWTIHRHMAGFGGME